MPCQRGVWEFCIRSLIFLVRTALIVYLDLRMDTRRDEVAIEKMRMGEASVANSLAGRGQFPPKESVAVGGGP